MNINLYIELLKLGVFSLNDVDEFYSNKNSSNSAIRALLKKGLIKNVRKNLYVCNDLKNNLPMAGNLNIGCGIKKDAYASHHSALEFHGLSNSRIFENHGLINNLLNNHDKHRLQCQNDSDGYSLVNNNLHNSGPEDRNLVSNNIENSNLKNNSLNDNNLRSNLEDSNLRNNNLHGCNQKFYIVYVSSASRFKTFYYDFNKYIHVSSKSQVGVVTENREGLNVRVTNLERTVIDCIKDLDRAGGIEEFTRCLQNITTIDSSKLLQYLDMYDQQFLYQKTGFIMETSKYPFILPRKFYDKCASKIKSTRYLTNYYEKDQVYVSKWHLLVSGKLIYNIKWM